MRSWTTYFYLNRAVAFFDGSSLAVQYTWCTHKEKELSTPKPDAKCLQCGLSGRSALSSRLDLLPETKFWAGSVSYSLIGTCKTSGNFTGPYHRWTLKNGHMHLMSRVLRFHDAVYMYHRSTFWSFPLKEQPDGQQQQSFPTGNTRTTHQMTMPMNPCED